jgi:hypothetical protein
MPLYEINPSFKNLTPEILMNLRLSLTSNHEPENATVGIWAEKLLRYCEIRQADLRNRVKEKWKKDLQARQNMSDIAGFLFEYYKSYHDIRFLNVVLKLSDKRWVALPDSLLAGIEAEITALAGKRR